MAEGVETREEYWKLKELGVTYGQGYLFGEPSPDLGDLNLEELQLAQPAQSEAGPVTR